MAKPKPTIGVFKLTSCDGCQLSIINCPELLELVRLFDLSYFREVLDRQFKGGIDIAFVEGSVSTDRQLRELIAIRESARMLVTIGACATAGGIQALRNWASFASYKERVYPAPEMIEALSVSTPVSQHVFVDFELWGCPITSGAIVEVLGSLLVGRRLHFADYSLCLECKMNGTICLLIDRQEPCLGPVTRAGCNALCPALDRPCYGCFGPREDSNIPALRARFAELGMDQRGFTELLDRMNSYAYRREELEQTD